jgi:hypothetical protein
MNTGTVTSPLFITKEPCMNRCVMSSIAGESTSGLLHQKAVIVTAG